MILADSTWTPDAVFSLVERVVNLLLSAAGVALALWAKAKADANATRQQDHAERLMTLDSDMRAIAMAVPPAAGDGRPPVSPPQPQTPTPQAGGSALDAKPPAVAGPSQPWHWEKE